MHKVVYIPLTAPQLSRLVELASERGLKPSTMAAQLIEQGVRRDCPDDVGLRVRDLYRQTRAQSRRREAAA